MTQREANEFLEEIQGELRKLVSCKELAHEDELTSEMKMNRLSLIPNDMLAEMDLLMETEEFRNSLAQDRAQNL